MRVLAETVVMSRLAAEYRTRAGQDSDIREQMPILYAWARHATTVIELGVRAGNSTAAFLAALEGHGDLWSVDITTPDVPAWWHDLPHWHLLVADDRDPEAAAYCPSYADVLFIDTSHDRDHTLTELGCYVPKVRPGGVVLMHDTGPGWPGVAAALTAYGLDTGLDWYDHPGWPGLGVIEVPDA